MSTLDSRDREILEYLHRSAGADIASMCDFLGVTRTAVRHRISRLEAEGLVCCGPQSPPLSGSSRGRPRLLFQVTPDGLHSLGQNYRQMAVVMWQVITGISDLEMREQLLAKVRDTLAGDLRRRISGDGPLEERLGDLAAEMNANGFNVHSERSGKLQILRETSCPFPLLAEVDDSICRVEQEVLEQVLGVPVDVVSRCRDGAGCCEFQMQG